MCGIAGFCDFNNNSSESILRNMTNGLEHRGPDDSGYKFLQKSSAQIGLGHRRLSIIDLSPLGHQPMSFRNFEIVFNGEIYNYEEIRRELEQFGYQFKSQSDTEVVLAGFHKWGMKVVDKFIGMFAFVLFDADLQKLYLVRDRIGVKPLYYYFQNGLFLFASELKAFHSHPGFVKAINSQGLASFLQFGYIGGANTIFEKTYKVLPGHHLQISLADREYTETSYWNVEDFYRSKNDRSEPQLIEEIESLLKSACNYRMVADVPVGLFLSGGYDSSTVAALIQSDRTDKLKTFTIGFEEKAFNEAPHAKKIAGYLGTDHTEYYCSQQDALDIIPDIPFYFDEPFADDSQIPTMLVSKLARKDVTVALSADGGDEVFGGYPKYMRALRYAKLRGRIPGGGRISKFYDTASGLVLASHKRLGQFETLNNKLVELSRGGSVIDYARVETQQFEERAIKKILLNGNINTDQLSYHTDFFNDYQELDRLLLLDFKMFLPDDLMVKVDRSTMSVSLEGREPLLDHRLIEYMGGVNSDSKINFGANSTKHLLKQIAHKYIPRHLMERPKMGFNSPVLSWLKGPLRENLMASLDKHRIEQQGLFEYGEIGKIKRDFFDFNHQKSSKKLWNLFMFQAWYDKWMR